MERTPSIRPINRPSSGVLANQLLGATPSTRFLVVTFCLGSRTSLAGLVGPVAPLDTRSRLAVVAIVRALVAGQQVTAHTPTPKKDPEISPLKKEKR